jgi:hypothetical protein
MAQEAQVIEPATVKTPADREREARERVECITGSAGGRAQAMSALHRAVLCADWRTLEYTSLAEYLEVEGIAAALAEAARREEKVLPDLVAELRSAGLTQAQAGAALGITQARVSQLERGITGHEQRDRRRQERRENISQSPETASDQGEAADVAYIEDQSADVQRADAQPDGAGVAQHVPATPWGAAAGVAWPSRPDAQPCARCAELAREKEQAVAALAGRVAELERQLAAARDRIASLEQAGTKPELTGVCQATLDGGGECGSAAPVAPAVVRQDGQVFEGVLVCGGCEARLAAAGWSVSR